MNKNSKLEKFVIFISITLIFASNANANPVFSNLNYYPINVPSQIASVALGINRFGEVVGTVTSSAQVQTGGYQTDSFAWTSDGYTIFNKINSTYSQANGVNDNGYIVGEYRDSTTTNISENIYGDNIFHGFTIENGVFDTFDVPASARTGIQTINDLGIIGGWYNDNLGNTFGFIDNNGVFRKFSYGNGEFTEITGINNHGDIVGFYYNNGSFSGFSIINGVFEKIMVPGSYYTTVYGINDNNQVVGDYFTGGSIRHGFVYTDNKYYKIEFPGHIDSTFARGINDAGVIVGGYQNGSSAYGFVATNGTFDSISVEEPPISATLGLAAVVIAMLRRRRPPTRMGSVISNTIST